VSKSPAAPGFFFGPMLRPVRPRETDFWQWRFACGDFAACKIFSSNNLQAARDIGIRDARAPLLPN
jgi:hypothetical protein